jgi:D,D-heptose 1,7-bisphosphate phosphatase
MRIDDFRAPGYRKAVFLDKDGTLIPNVPYNVNPELIRLAPGAAEALPALHAAGYALVVITNQSGVARGYYTPQDQDGVAARLRELLDELGVPLTGYYYCPHLPEGSVAGYAIHCNCRKPLPGLVIQAATEHQLDATRSWFVGDILHDIEAGRQAGCRTVLIDNGGEEEWLLSRRRLPHHVVADLGEAARVILAMDGPLRGQANGHAQDNVSWQRALLTQPPVWPTSWGEQ